MTPSAAPRTPPNPSSLSVRCPSCGHQLWNERGGEWVLDSSAVKLTNGGMVAKCGRRGAKKGCGTEVPIPWLRIVKEPRRRRLVVRRPPIP